MTICFPGQSPPARPTKDSGSESDSDSGFVSPVSVSLPVAKLLPIMAAQVDRLMWWELWLLGMEDIGDRMLLRYKQMHKWNGIGNGVELKCVRTKFNMSNFIWPCMVLLHK